MRPRAVCFKGRPFESARIAGYDGQRVQGFEPVAENGSRRARDVTRHRNGTFRPSSERCRSAPAASFGKTESKSDRKMLWRFLWPNRADGIEVHGQN